MCKCIEHVQMRWKCANAWLMCKCENVQMCKLFVAYVECEMVKCKLENIFTFSHLHISNAFSHSHILTFAHLLLLVHNFNLLTYTLFVNALEYVFNEVR